MDINEIYAAYLNLITYLEEKFPGGVGGVFSVVGSAPYLLAVAPTTPAIRDTLIRPVCERFNELGSTQLEVIPFREGTLIGAKDITPVLYVVYRAVQAGLQVRGHHYLGGKDRLSTWKYPNTVKPETPDLLKEWLESLIQKTASPAACQQLGLYSNQYAERRHHYETAPLNKWVNALHGKLMAEAMGWEGDEDD